MKMNLHRQSTFSWEWFRTKTRFETEAKGNKEMTYCNLAVTRMDKYGETLKFVYIKYEPILVKVLPKVYQV